MGAPIQIKITDNFEGNLEEIQHFLGDEKESAFDDLIGQIFDVVIPNLERFPDIGRDFLAGSALSVEGISRAERLKSRMGAATLREYVFGDHLLLYARAGRRLYLLAIRHHRQLSFDLESHWRWG